MLNYDITHKQKKSVKRALKNLSKFYKYDYEDLQRGGVTLVFNAIGPVQLKMQNNNLLIEIAKLSYDTGAHDAEDPDDEVLLYKMVNLYIQQFMLTLSLDKSPFSSYSYSKKEIQEIKYLLAFFEIMRNIFKIQILRYCR